MLLMRFTSGVTCDNKYIINMEAYNENDIPTAWEMTKLYHKLDENANISFDHYEETWLTVEWEGNIFYPTFNAQPIEGSMMARIFNIKDNLRNVLS